MSTDEKVAIGVIGGSGLYHLDNLTFVKTVNPETPWGHPSAPITLARLPSPGSSSTEHGPLVAFIARHGVGHAIAPSAIPSRANIAALKSLGVRCILAFSAVGSLRENIPPGAFVLPDQIIDRTKGVRPVSFFEGTGVVAHAAFGDPFSVKLGTWLREKVKDVLDARGTQFADRGTLVVMEGPQFSTRAESVLYRAWGGDLINMSTLPEAKLAREAEISYALLCTATDYDSWRPAESAVTAHDVFQTLSQNADTARHVAEVVLPLLANEHHLVGEEEGSMRLSIMKRPEEVSAADAKTLAWVLPAYFGATAAIN